MANIRVFCALAMLSDLPSPVKIVNAACKIMIRKIITAPTPVKGSKRLRIIPKFANFAAGNVVGLIKGVIVGIKKVYYNKIDKSTIISTNMIPNHVAIILDGNRRWARERGLPTFEGHRRGFDVAKKIVTKASELGIKILTLWVFSTENWGRAKEEVSYLMNLYEMMIDQSLKEALKEKIKITHLGRKDRLNKNLLKKIVNAEEKTKNFDKYYLNIALDYGGRDEILRTIKAIYNSEFKIQNLDDKSFNQFLDTKNLPQSNVDLVIRTSGEKRTSGFMIWQAAYAEYIFVKKNFPDFTTEDLENCIKEYSERKRRYGR